MIVDLQRLDPEGERLTGAEPGDVLDVHEEGVETGEPVRYRLDVRRVTDELLVRGVVEAKVEFVCSRCAKRFRRRVADEAFERAIPVEGRETVDLTADIREAILLSFPNYPLCRADCRGLCPQCGASRNRGPCGCRAAHDGEEWKALDGLHLE